MRLTSTITATRLLLLAVLDFLLFQGRLVAAEDTHRMLKALPPQTTVVLSRTIFLVRDA